MDQIAGGSLSEAAADNGAGAIHQQAKASPKTQRSFVELFDVVFMLLRQTEFIPQESDFPPTV
jgi:hypothetical protein